MDEKYLALRGRIHTFPDGIKLRIVDIKQRETEPWVTYETIYQLALPRRESTKLRDFLDRYGHLFQFN